MTVIPDLKILYEIDDSLWLEATIELLKSKRFDALDLDNLIEELEDLGWLDIQIQSDRALMNGKLVVVIHSSR